MTRGQLADFVRRALAEAAHETILHIDMEAMEQGHLGVALTDGTVFAVSITTPDRPYHEEQRA